MGKMMIDILGAFAEFERNSMLERTQAGLAAARARSSKGGRRKLLDDSKVAELKNLRDQGFTVSRLAEMLRISGAVRLPVPEQMTCKFDLIRRLLTGVPAAPGPPPHLDLAR